MANENEHEGSQETTESNETLEPSRWRTSVRTRVLTLVFALGLVLALACVSAVLYGSRDQSEQEACASGWAESCFELGKRHAQIRDDRTSERLAAEEGLHVGHSSGANVFGALKIAERVSKEHGKGCVVTIACDRGDRYFAPIKWEANYVW